MLLRDTDVTGGADCNEQCIDRVRRGLARAGNAGPEGRVGTS